MYTHLSLSLVFGKIFQSRFKYRDRASIIGDILDSINSDPRGKTKTSIMRGANLSLDQVNKYLQHLVVSGVVKTIEPLESQEIGRYKLTTKGLQFARDVATWRCTLAPYRRGQHKIA
jgi:predicted transcriptional regulator